MLRETLRQSLEIPADLLFRFAGANSGVGSFLDSLQVEDFLENFAFMRSDIAVSSLCLRRERFLDHFTYVHTRPRV
jgi:hypothetical protein